MTAASETRPPIVAGQFYPLQPDRLRSEIESYLSRVEPDRSRYDIVALISPHAGYIYSGPVAACAYRQIQGKSYDSVVVIAPSHRSAFGFSSVFGGRAYATPLGEIETDLSAVEKLESLGDGLVRISEEGHTRGEEHSLEVQLPFLQVVLGEFRLVPIIMGHQSRDAALALAEALAGTFRERRVLIAASTDLSHFHSQERAESLDSRVVERIDDFDPDGLFEDISQGRAEACGGGPACAAMIAARKLGATRGENLSYMTSAARSGDLSHVVGYTSGIFYR